ncbi:MAG: class I adenylate-forming enzyme family protein [Chthoniobacteraceae bacterium]
MMSNPLSERWEKVCRDLADSPAILAADSSVLRSFSQIETEAREFQLRFREIPTGSVLALQPGNSPVWPALLLAAFRQGLVPLPLADTWRRWSFRQALELSGAILLLRVAMGKTDLEWLPLSSALTPVDAGFLKLTSGTTSAPRLVRFEVAQLVADCDQICETKGITGDDLNYGVIPFSHSYGFSNLLTPLLCRGIRLVASEDRMPRAILEGLARTRATVFPGTPTFFQAFGEMQNAPELPGLRLCISAGAPLTPSVALRFHERFGQKVRTFYGSSECGGIAYDSAEEIVTEPGYVGQPMTGVTITPQESGLIEVRSPAVGLGYFPTPEPATYGSGRFIPGDLVHLTPEGLFLTGRASEIINVAGRKLNPLEVEAELTKCPGVKQAVVFGVNSGLRGEAPIVCVAGNVTAQIIAQFAQRQLSEWQRPRDYWIVGEIPANDRGKISRRELAKRYLEQR